MTIGFAVVFVVLGFLIIAAILGGGGDSNTCDTTGDVAGSISNSKDKTKRAKSMYDFLRSQGATPQAAAGILGVWEMESQLDPNALNSSSGAFGVAQWLGSRKTNLQNFAKSQGKQANSLDVQMKWLMKELNSTHKSSKHILKDKDVHETVLDWLKVYEGLSQDPSQWHLSTRNKYADRWYTKFGASDSGGDSNISDGSEAADTNTESGECGEGNDVEDGSGKIAEDPSKQGGSIHWNYGKEPADVKKYLKDPKKSGLTFSQGGKGWFNPGGQCVHFASSYFKAIHKGAPSVMTMYGRDNAKNWAKNMGGKVSSTPHAGAMASGANLPHITSGDAGHTWIVLHVLANGDTIIAEQNMANSSGGISGDDANKPDTWNFGVISKAYAEKHGIQYFTPDSKKYPLNW